LTLAAPDGTQLAASFYPPTSAAPVPGVLLIHMLAGCACRGDWAAFAQELQKDGFAALALDLRGHGDSPGPEDWNKAPGDVRAAWDVLVKRPEVEGQPSAMVGASIGANLALIVGANNNDVVTVIALSPGNDYHGLKPSGVLGNFGERPVFFAVSQSDGYSYDSVRQMLPLLSQTDVFYAASGHGTQMFSDTALAPALLGWLEKYLALKG
jgi:alpha-beta hydrolase superfamily lysophospholipase